MAANDGSSLTFPLPSGFTLAWQSEVQNLNRYYGIIIKSAKYNMIYVIIMLLTSSYMIILTLKPSFCRQRANLRAPSFASSSLNKRGEQEWAAANSGIQHSATTWKPLRVTWKTLIIWSQCNGLLGIHTTHPNIVAAPGPLALGSVVAMRRLARFVTMFVWAVCHGVPSTWIYSYGVSDCFSLNVSVATPAVSNLLRSK